MRRPIVVQRGVAPPLPRENTQTNVYPWEDLGPPVMGEDADGNSEMKLDSFFVPYEMKNPAATIAKAKERYPDRDFEWRRVTEDSLRENDDGVEMMLPTRGVRFWRTK